MNFAIFRFPIVFHILPSPTSMNFPSFSLLPFVNLLFSGKVFGRIYATRGCTCIDLNLNVTHFRIAVNDEIKQHIFSDVLEKLWNRKVLLICISVFTANTNNFHVSQECKR